MKKKKLKIILSRIENRLDTLEALTSKEVPTSKIEVHFENVTEGLPEKWCIAITDETIVTVGNWFNENSQTYSKDYHEYKSGYLHYPVFIQHGNECHQDTDIQEGYTEITFAQFQKWVPKEEAKEAEPIDFSKAGQLVKSNDGTVLIYTTDETPKDEHHFSGTVLESDIHKKGHTCNNWLIKMFTLCTEPVTLSN